MYRSHITTSPHHPITTSPITTSPHHDITTFSNLSDVSRVRGGDAAAHAAGPRAEDHRARRVRHLPGLLVRPLREPAAVAGRHAEALLDDGGAGNRESAAYAPSDLSALRQAAHPRARLAVQHAVSVLAMRGRQRRTLHHVRRVPAREAVRACADAAGDRG